MPTTLNLVIRAAQVKIANRLILLCIFFSDILILDENSNSGQNVSTGNNRFGNKTNTARNN